MRAKVAASRIKVGADVLPWWLARGVYVLVETDAPTPTDLAGAPARQTLSYCFLDQDPVVAAGRLRLALEQRWADGTATPLFAAPYHVVVAHEWDRHVP